MSRRQMKLPATQQFPEYRPIFRNIPQKTFIAFALASGFYLAFKAINHRKDSAAPTIAMDKPDSSTQKSPVSASLVRKFPDSFIWGTATASYQIEGSTNVDGRVPSIWDVFSKTSKHMKTRASGDVACDHYRRFRQDVQLIKALGTKYYRFSIAWPRILPNGTKGAINQRGVKFYSDLIDELLRNDITPVVTLYHWDLPVPVQALTNGGWIGDGTVADEFAAYSKVCFEHFGDRVKWWITLNEPWCSSLLGYGTGEHAPGRTEKPAHEPYLAAHHLLRAHGMAVRAYRAEFAHKQQGKIGITLNSDWGEPARSVSTEPKADDEAAVAAKRFMEFNLGWFADPIYNGDYPAVMRETVGDRLPRFSSEERSMLLGSSDFFGLNHYSTHSILGMSENLDCEKESRDDIKGNADSASSMAPSSLQSFWTDECVRRESDVAWDRTDMGWAIAPWGFRKLLNYIQTVYSPKGGIIVTENGMAAHEPNLDAAMADRTRVAFYQDYLTELHRAIAEDGVDVRGYFLWSLMDNFEWAYGYLKRFGLYYVDYETQERIAKPAVAWYSDVVRSNRLKMK